MSAEYFSSLFLIPQKNEWIMIDVIYVSGVHFPDHHETVMGGQETPVWTHQGAEKYSRE